jgi:hypothetical protein
MASKNYSLFALVSSDKLSAVEPVLEHLFDNKGTLKKTSEGFEIQAKMEGESARALNRALLSELRKAEKRTRLRAEWTCGNTVEKFFDYVPKGVRKTE